MTKPKKCQVPLCRNPLDLDRCRVCKQHRLASNVDGKRYCNQCKQWHEVEEFELGRRSCLKCRARRNKQTTMQTQPMEEAAALEPADTADYHQPEANAWLYPMPAATPHAQQPCDPSQSAAAVPDRPTGHAAANQQPLLGDAVLEHDMPDVGNCVDDIDSDDIDMGRMPLDEDGNGHFLGDAGRQFAALLAEGPANSQNERAAAGLQTVYAGGTLQPTDSGTRALASVQTAVTTQPTGAPGSYSGVVTTAPEFFPMAADIWTLTYPLPSIRVVSCRELLVHVPAGLLWVERSAGGACRDLPGPGWHPVGLTPGGVGAFVPFAGGKSLSELPSIRLDERGQYSAYAPAGDYLAERIGGVIAYRPGPYAGAVNLAPGSGYTWFPDPRGSNIFLKPPSGPSGGLPPAPGWGGGGGSGASGSGGFGPGAMGGAGTFGGNPYYPSSGAGSGAGGPSFGGFSLELGKAAPVQRLAVQAEHSDGGSSGGAPSVNRGALVQRPQAKGRQAEGADAQSLLPQQPLQHTAHRACRLLTFSPAAPACSSSGSSGGVGSGLDCGGDRKRGGGRSGGGQSGGGQSRGEHPSGNAGGVLAPVGDALQLPACSDHSAAAAPEPPHGSAGLKPVPISGEAPLPSCGLGSGQLGADGSGAAPSCSSSGSVEAPAYNGVTCMEDDHGHDVCSRPLDPSGCHPGDGGTPEAAQLAKRPLQDEASSGALRVIRRRRANEHAGGTSDHKGERGAILALQPGSQRGQVHTALASWDSARPSAAVTGPGTEAETGRCEQQQVRVTLPRQLQGWNRKGDVEMRPQGGSGLWPEQKAMGATPGASNMDGIGACGSWAPAGHLEKGGGKFDAAGEAFKCAAAVGIGLTAGKTEAGGLHDTVSEATRAAHSGHEAGATAPAASNAGGCGSYQPAWHVRTLARAQLYATGPAGSCLAAPASATAGPCDPTYHPAGAHHGASDCGEPAAASGATMAGCGALDADADGVVAGDRALEQCVWTASEAEKLIIKQAAEQARREVESCAERGKQTIVGTCALEIARSRGVLPDQERVSPQHAVNTGGLPAEELGAARFGLAPLLKVHRGHEAEATAPAAGDAGGCGSDQPAWRARTLAMAKPAATGPAGSGLATPASAPHPTVGPCDPTYHPASAHHGASACGEPGAASGASAGAHGLQETGQARTMDVDGVVACRGAPEQRTALALLECLKEMRKDLRDEQEDEEFCWEARVQKVLSPQRAAGTGGLPAEELGAVSLLLAAWRKVRPTLPQRLQGWDHKGDIEMRRQEGGGPWAEQKAIGATPDASSVGGIQDRGSWAPARHLEDAGGTSDAAGEAYEGTAAMGVGLTAGKTVAGGLQDTASEARSAAHSGHEAGATAPAASDAGGCGSDQPAWRARTLAMAKPAATGPAGSGLATPASVPHATAGLCDPTYHPAGAHHGASACGEPAAASGAGMAGCGAPNAGVDGVVACGGAPERRVLAVSEAEKLTIKQEAEEARREVESCAERSQRVIDCTCAREVAGIRGTLPDQEGLSPQHAAGTVELPAGGLGAVSSTLAILRKGGISAVLVRSQGGYMHAVAELLQQESERPRGVRQKLAGSSDALPKQQHAVDTGGLPAEELGAARFGLAPLLKQLQGWDREGDVEMRRRGGSGLWPEPEQKAMGATPDASNMDGMRVRGSWASTRHLEEGGGIPDAAGEAYNGTAAMGIGPAMGKTEAGRLQGTGSEARSAAHAASRQEAPGYADGDGTARNVEIWAPETLRLLQLLGATTPTSPQPAPPNACGGMQADNPPQGTAANEQVEGYGLAPCAASPGAAGRSPLSGNTFSSGARYTIHLLADRPDYTTKVLPLNQDAEETSIPDNVKQRLPANARGLGAADWNGKRFVVGTAQEGAAGLSEVAAQGRQPRPGDPGEEHMEDASLPNQAVTTEECTNTDQALARRPGKLLQTPRPADRPDLLSIPDTPVWAECEE